MDVADGLGIALQPGEWFRQPYWVEMGEAGIPYLLPQYPAGTHLRTYSLAALAADGEGALAEFVGLLGNGAPSSAEAVEHWRGCDHSGCARCGLLVNAVADLTTRCGLLGLWAVDSVGDSLTAPWRNAGRFGDDTGRTEPVELVLEARLALAELWDAARRAHDPEATEEARAHAADALMWGTLAEDASGEQADLARRMGMPEPMVKTLRKVLLVDPTVQGLLTYAAVGALPPRPPAAPT